jgi:hypothetical protein
LVRTPLIAAALLVSAGAAAQAPFLAAPTRARAEIEAYRALVSDAARIRGSISWDGVRTKDALGEIRRRLGRTVLMAPSLKDRSDDAVSIELKDVSLATACRVLGEALRARFVFDGGVLWLTTPEDADLRRLETRVYDVAEALYAPPDFPGPEIGIHPGKPKTDPVESTPGEGRSVVDLIELIRTVVGESAFNLEGASIAISGRLLVVRLTPEGHATVRRLLAFL